MIAFWIHNYELEALVNFHMDKECDAANKQEYLEAKEHKDRVDEIKTELARRKEYPHEPGRVSVGKKIDWFNALTPEQQAAHREQQRQSWARGEAGFAADVRKHVDPLTGAIVYEDYTSYCND